MRILTFLVVSAFVFAVTPARANHNEPLKSKTAKVEFVTAYNPCTSPNATTGSGFPACTPAVRSDPGCGFGPKGSGKAAATVVTGDVKVAASLSGLDAGCEGQQLELRTDVVGTLDDCSGQPCTVVQIAVPLGSCVVVKGKCKIKTTVNTVTPGLIPPNKRLGVCHLGHNWWRPYPSVRTFWSGLFIK